MGTLSRQPSFWAPRVLTFALALFLSVFALDVFGGDASLGQKLAALVIHLVPTWIVLLVLAVSWRHEWVGGVLFPALCIAYFVLTKGQMHWTAYLMLCGPLLLIGLLFWWSWAGHAKRRRSA